MVTKVKTGIVFEGGAFRTIFSCGVMDALVENDIMPDYMIGVSAGAAYGVSMASKQPRRNLDVLMKYRNDKRYLGLSNMIDKDNKSIYGLEFSYETIPNELNLFDYDAFKPVSYTHLDVYKRQVFNQIYGALTPPDTV